MSTLQTSSPTVLLTRLAWSTFRRLKPELPETGAHDIPIEHEIEFEYPL